MNRIVDGLTCHIDRGHFIRYESMRLCHSSLHAWRLPGDTANPSTLERALYIWPEWGESIGRARKDLGYTPTKVTVANVLAPRSLDENRDRTWRQENQQRVEERKTQHARSAYNLGRPGILAGRLALSGVTGCQSLREEPCPFCYHHVPI